METKNTWIGLSSLLGVSVLTLIASEWFWGIHRACRTADPFESILVVLTFIMINYNRRAIINGIDGSLPGL
jgi:hypothetical protein